MNVLCACEESQEVCKAFRARGHMAFSCDLLQCSGGHPEWHIHGDVLPLINGSCVFSTMDGLTHSLEGEWDLLIAFPPCTYLSNASAVRMRVNGKLQLDRYSKAMDAKVFFLKFFTASCNKICIENPTPLKLVNLPPYSQVVQPYEHGHPYSKRTCLWLKGLPGLMATDIYSWHEPYVNGGCKDAHGTYLRFQGRKERDPLTRAKTFPGIAKAMAVQWG